MSFLLVATATVQMWIATHTFPRGMTCVACGGMLGGDPSESVCFNGAATAEQVAPYCKHERPMS